ncbi:MAG: hypothetical protein WBB98_00120 [Xanthobacteraceae bacterium]
MGKRKQHYIDGSGRLVEIDDGDEIMRNGEIVSTPMMLMDSLQRAIMADSAGRTDDAAQREKLLDAYEARDARLTSAWKDAPPVAEVADRAKPTGDRLDAYEARDARLRDAWRNPV